jgi:hypothetical protein
VTGREQDLEHYVIFRIRNDQNEAFGGWSAEAASLVTLTNSVIDLGKSDGLERSAGKDAIERTCIGPDS